MGSRIVPGGVAFRVWAPFATSVSVAGTFNQWNSSAHPLASEDNGYWSADVAGAAGGDAYKYVITTTHAAEPLWRSDPYALNVSPKDTYNAIVEADAFDWTGDTFTLPPWNELVVYELHIGTFYDPNAHDGNPGTLAAAKSKIPYLRDLGINAILIMPSYEFPTGYSWGYNPSHIFAIEDSYGGPDALYEFIRTAHAHGIGVIMDVVYNHLGPHDLDLWQFDGWRENDKGGIYFYNDHRDYTRWGHTRPDYGRGPVRQFLRDNAVFWLRTMHADGLRFDATAFIRNIYGNDNDPGNDIPDGWSLMQWINDEAARCGRPCLTVAEDLKCNPWITRTTGEGGAGFGTQWDAAFVHPVRDAIIATWDASRAMHAVRDAIAHRHDGDACKRVIYTESHDEVANGKARVPYEIAPNDAGGWFARKRSTLGAALVFTAPGIPMILQGQEFLEDKWFHDQDPIEWERVDWYAGILRLYQDLIRLRTNRNGATRGLTGQHVNVHHLNDTGKVLAYHRWEFGGTGDDVVIVLNFADRTHHDYRIGVPRGGLWRLRLNSDWTGYSPDYGNLPVFDTHAEAIPWDGLAHSITLNLAPYTALIFSQ